VFALVQELLFEEGFNKYENYFPDCTKIEADVNKCSFVWGKSIKQFKERLQKTLKKQSAE
jgi:transposase